MEGDFLVKWYISKIIEKVNEKVWGLNCYVI